MEILLQDIIEQDALVHVWFAIEIAVARIPMQIQQIKAKTRVLMLWQNYLSTFASKSNFSPDFQAVKEEK